MADDLTFRTIDLTDADLDDETTGFVQAVLRGFHDDRADEEFARRWLEFGREDGMVLRGAWPAEPPLGAGDRPVATIASFAEDLHVGGGVRLPAHLVTDVTVSPTHRRRGLMRRLITDDLADAAGRGRPVAALHVSEGSIYGRFGFGPATWARQVEVDTSALFRLRDDAAVAGGELVLLDPTEGGDALDRVFAAFHATSRGSVSRPAFYRWFTHEAYDMARRARDTKAHLVVHLEDGDPVGYVRYHHEGEADGRPTVRVLDLVAATTGSYLRLWRFLADIDLAERVVWRHAPVRDPLPWALVEPRCVRVVRETDQLWVRVLDVAAALEARPWGDDGTVVLDVRDGLGHAAGRWRVTASAGAAQVGRTGDDAELSLDVETLGALYLGGVEVGTLAAAGRITGDPGALTTWAALADTGPAPYGITGF